jgi:hypothetical protein
MPAWDGQDDGVAREPAQSGAGPDGPAPTPRKSRGVSLAGEQLRDGLDGKGRGRDVDPAGVP